MSCRKIQDYDLDNNSDNIRLYLGAGTNPNLLDNWYFANPINQRGQTEYTENGYGIDRWTSNAANQLVSDGYLRLSLQTGKTAAWWIRQYFEDGFFKSLVGKTVTVSFLCRKGRAGISLLLRHYLLSSMTNTSAKGNTEIQMITSTVTVPEITTTTYSLGLVTDGALVEGDYIDIYAAKLEIGSKQTLAHQDAEGNWVLNEIPNYAEQMAICSQYDPLTGEYIGIPQYNHYNPNLLDNWYFADPIDQRNGKLIPPGTEYYSFGTDIVGTTSDYVPVKRVDSGYGAIFEIDGAEYNVGIGYAIRGYAENNNIYTIDRWCVIGAAVLPDSSNKYINLIPLIDRPYSNFYQYIDEPERLSGKTVTLSILYSGQGKLIIGDRNTSMTNDRYHGKDLDSDSINIESITMTLLDNLNNIFIVIQLPEENDISEQLFVYAVKLELGSEQTLAHQDAEGNWVLSDLPPNKVLELAKCQWYYEKSCATDIMPGNPSTEGAISKVAADAYLFCDSYVRFGTSKRITPNVKIFSAYTGEEGMAYDSTAGADAAVAVVHVNENGFRVNHASSNLIAGHLYNFYYVADAQL